MTLADSMPEDSSSAPFGPEHFYFNGQAMPEHANSWAMANILRFLRPESEFGQVIGHEEIRTVYCCIDHWGVVESEDALVFLYVVQEVLGVLLREREAIQAELGGLQDLEGATVYAGLLEGAFAMRRLVLAERRAFWTSGNAEDQFRLLRKMEACVPYFAAQQEQTPPHEERRRSQIETSIKSQEQELRGLSYDRSMPPALRARLQKL